MFGSPHSEKLSDKQEIGSYSQAKEEASANPNV